MRAVKKRCPCLSAMYLTVKEKHCGQGNEDGLKRLEEEYSIEELSIIVTIFWFTYPLDSWHIEAIQ